MKTIFLLTTLFLGITTTFSQVGIGTVNPKAKLDVSALDSTNPENTDGILVPRLGVFPTTQPTGDQDGMLIYLATQNGSNQSGFYYWDAVLSSWKNLLYKQHYVGEFYGGGIVFYTYDNGKHGYIVSLQDLHTGLGNPWGVVGVNVPGAESFWNGILNTTQIVNFGAGTTDAAYLCQNYNAGGFTDWYLPSILELTLLYSNASVITRILETDGDSSTSGFSFLGNYWSSTETPLSPDFAIAYSFFYGSVNNLNYKSNPNFVRAIRVF